MEQRKEGLVVANLNKNPVEQLQVKFKELENGYKSWLSRQCLAVEAAVVTATSAVQGAAIGALMATLTNDFSSSVQNPPSALNSDAMASFKQAQALAGGPLVQARNFAVITGVNAGISCVMKRLRGKEDIQSSMVAAFGSGAIYSLVSGMGGQNNIPAALGSGFFFSLVQGGLFKVGEKFSPANQPEDIYYARTRSMLRTLGFERYEKKFRTGMLTDSTLPLLTNSALREVGIPPGPRLLILDHIQRYACSSGMLN
uniref:Uncharacterized protein MANES_05G197500 n=1 Tax=Rhizophora mucronata TaxID=61149 RepID=A0A2P2KDL6_RHIMU